MKKKISILLAVMMLAAVIPVNASALTFRDVPGHWAEAYIEKATDRKLVYGDLTNYRPDDSMTRAELVTVLWRAAGSPEPKGKATFTDLTKSWYQKPIAWAEENKVVNGVGGGAFDPDGNITREQLATVLFRLSGGRSGMEVLFTSIYDSQFRDEDQISGYAKSALYWSIYNEVYCGVARPQVEFNLAPKADATRGQVAVMIVRYLDRNK